MGKDQSSYFGRCTNNTSRPGRNVTTPAARTSGGDASLLVVTALVSHLPARTEETANMSISRRRLIVLGVVLLLVVAGAVAWVVTTRGDDDDAGRLATAVAMAPKDSARLGWTDWSGVRKELDFDLTAASSTRDVQGFLDEGFNADLTSTSALVASAPVLQEQYGFSPATVDWELFAQSEEGAIVLIGLPDSIDLDQLEDTDRRHRLRAAERRRRRVDRRVRTCSSTWAR